MQIEGFFPINFVVLEMDPSHTSKQIPLILGCTFLAIANATINYRLGVMDIFVINKSVLTYV